MEIGQRLRTCRLLAGLTQDTAAQSIGVSRQTIFNWETNRSYPDAVSVMKLSQLYRVSCETLLGGEQPANTPLWLTLK